MHDHAFNTQADRWVSLSYKWYDFVAVGLQPLRVHLIRSSRPLSLPHQGFIAADSPWMSSFNPSRRARLPFPQSRPWQTEGRDNWSTLVIIRQLPIASVFKGSNCHVHERWRIFLFQARNLFSVGNLFFWCEIGSWKSLLITTPWLISDIQKGDCG
jgi:hypothetical protein